MVRKILHHDWIPRRQSRFVYPLSRSIYALAMLTPRSLAVVYVAARVAIAAHLLVVARESLQSIPFVSFSMIGIWGMLRQQLEEEYHGRGLGPWLRQRDHPPWGSGRSSVLDHDSFFAILQPVGCAAWSVVGDRRVDLSGGLGRGYVLPNKFCPSVRRPFCPARVQTYCTTIVCLSYRCTTIVCLSYRAVKKFASLMRLLLYSTTMRVILAQKPFYFSPLIELILSQR